MTLKQTLAIALIFLASICRAGDSLHIESRYRDLQHELSGKLNAIKYQVHKDEQKLNALHLQINQQNETQQIQFVRLQKSLERNAVMLDCLQVKLNHTRQEVGENHEMMHDISVTSWVFQVVSIGLILFLIVYVLILRSSSLEAISGRAVKIADGNAEIMNTLTQLSVVRKNLDELLQEQKKIRKTVKKKGKK